MKRILFAGAVAIAAATQAFAADLPPPMAPPPRAPAAYVPIAPAWSWSGIYIGLNGGYGFGNSTWSTSTLAISSGSFSTNGPQFGVTLGGNYQIGQLVLGVEGDYDWQNIRGSNSSAPCSSIGNTFGGGAGGCDTASNWIATIRGRVGYAFDRIMVYGTAGGAGTDIKTSSGSLPWASSTEFGWTAGGGVEGAITDNLLAKVEYLYADFGNATCSSATNCGVSNATVSLKESMVRVGLNYKFDY
jgi:outer membrane immunogenic protein